MSVVMTTISVDKRKIGTACLVLLFVLVESACGLRVESLLEVHKDVSSITIEWSANGDESADWVGFKIKYFTNKLQFAPVLLRNTQLRKFRLDNLKSNTEYKIQVSAFNKLEQEGPASSLLSVKTLESGK